MTPKKPNGSSWYTARRKDALGNCPEGRSRRARRSQKRREFREETGRSLEEPCACAVVVETYESPDSEHVVEGVVFVGKAGERVAEPEEATDEVRVFRTLPDELTHITFNRGKFETLVKEARSFVKEDSDE